MYNRYLFTKNKITSPEARILEIGPLNGPLASKKDFPNTFYVDIRSTEDVKQLYSGNDYLNATGIQIPIEDIVDIDYVLNENYQKTFSNVEQFDYVVMCHVMEHVEDIIFFLQDITSVIKPGGKLLLVYPDKRYCFDHFREAVSFRDAYRIYRGGAKQGADLALDFFFSAVDNNDATLYWSADGVESHLPLVDFQRAKQAFENVLSGQKEDDVHFWPFSDRGFLQFLYDGIRAGLISFSCSDFIATEENSQQFFVELEYAPNICDNPHEELTNLNHWLQTIPPDYPNSKQLRLQDDYKSLQGTFASVVEQKEIATQKLITVQGRESDLQLQMIMVQGREGDLQQQLITVQGREGDLQQQLITVQGRESELQQQLIAARCYESDLLQQLIEVQQEAQEREHDLKIQLDAQNMVHGQQLQTNNDLLLQLNTLYSSTSWKITKPLRVVGRLLRKIMGLFH